MKKPLYPAWSAAFFWGVVLGWTLGLATVLLMAERVS